MFFIMGINSGQRRLNFDQVEVCRCCGRYGHIQVFMTYMYLSLFFIPIFKWNKRFYVKMSCCDAVAELDVSFGKAIARGEISRINYETLRFQNRYDGGSGIRRCGKCGFTTEEDFQYCPKCGNPL